MEKSELEEKYPLGCSRKKYHSSKNAPLNSEAETGKHNTNISSRKSLKKPDSASEQHLGPTWDHTCRHWELLDIKQFFRTEK